MRINNNRYLNSILSIGMYAIVLLISACSGSDSTSPPATDNIAPVINNDAFTVTSNSTTELDIAANDFDADDGLDLSSILIISAPASGTVIVNNGGTVDYTHDGSATTSDLFSYTINDNNGSVSNTGSVAITITASTPTPSNNVPVINNDSFTVTKGSTTQLDLAANDFDAEGGLDISSITIVTAPANGTVTINANGTVDYTHDASATTSDSFTYTIKDNSGAVSDAGDVSITIFNSVPLANDDNFTLTKGSMSVLDLVSNDSDENNDLDFASITIVSVPLNGSTIVNADGTVDYTHDDSSTTSDSFTYTIKDTSGEVSNTATVALTISPVTPPAVQLGIYDSMIVEGADDLEFVVSLAQASTVTVSVDYTTADVTAVAGTDYTAADHVLQFTPGEVRKFITIQVLDNPATPTGSSKKMQLMLSNPQNAVFSNDTADGVIIDNNRDAIASEVEFNPAWGTQGAFTNASKCSDGCHVSNGTKMDHLGEDVSPNTQWQYSVMANAFNDPYWQAAVEDEVDHFPALAGFIENTCTTCHAPIGRTHAHHTNTSLDTDDYFRFDTAKAQDYSREGVSCTVCHQIDSGNLGDGSFSGNFYIEGDPLDTNYKKVYGPYDSPVGSNMESQTGHAPTSDAAIAKSEMCATCHTLYTPALDADTAAPSGISFLEQAVYLEWQTSVYASGESKEAQCQDCHMPEPAAGYTTPISLKPNSAPDRTPYGQHTLVGGNSHLLEILSNYRTELGIVNTTTTAGFDEQITKTQDMLKTGGTVTLTDPASNDNTLEFDVEVSNLTGHKLPAGYPSRRVWLHVVVKNDSGQVIFESGKPDARGYISTDTARLKADCMAVEKLDGFDSSLCYEPHRDVIDDASQIAIYETVLGDTNDNITHTLLLGSQYLKDNRIPPEGFSDAKAAIIEPQMIPSGVSGDSDFNCAGGTKDCGTDTVHYQVDTTGESGAFTVDVRLLYQATQPAFVDGLHTDGDRVNRFKQMYDAVPPTVEVLDTTSK